METLINLNKINIINHYKNDDSKIDEYLYSWFTLGGSYLSDETLLFVLKEFDNKYFKLIKEKFNTKNSKELDSSYMKLDGKLASMSEIVGAIERSNIIDEIVAEMNTIMPSHNEAWKVNIEKIEFPNSDDAKEYIVEHTLKKLKENNYQYIDEEIDIDNLLINLLDGYYPEWRDYDCKKYDW